MEGQHGHLMKFDNSITIIIITVQCQTLIWDMKVSAKKFWYIAFYFFDGFYI